MKRAVAASVCAAALLLVSLIAYFVPWRKMLPAERLPAARAGEARLHFLDVGQGDCTIVESEGEVLVIDAGDGSYTHENALVRYLKGIRPERISMLLTHPDSDHYGGFSELLRIYKAETFYLPEFREETSEAYSVFLQAVRDSEYRTETAERYTVIPVGDLTLLCLSPYLAAETDENDASTVLYLDCEGVRAVLCGDISAAREKRLVNEYRMDERFFDVSGQSVRLDEIEILKVAHHGSAGSSSEEWLELLRPETAIVSCGAGNAYGHPSAEALSRLRAARPDAEIYRTDELGTLMVSMMKGQYTVSAGLEGYI